jgi:hypothetical protein
LGAAPNFSSEVRWLTAHGDSEERRGEGREREGEEESLRLAGGGGSLSLQRNTPNADHHAEFGGWIALHEGQPDSRPCPTCQFAIRRAVEGSSLERYCALATMLRTGRSPRLAHAPAASSSYRAPAITSIAACYGALYGVPQEDLLISVYAYYGVPGLWAHPHTAMSLHVGESGVPHAGRGLWLGSGHALPGAIICAYAHACVPASSDDDEYALPAIPGASTRIRPASLLPGDNVAPDGSRAWGFFAQDANSIDRTNAKALHTSRRPNAVLEYIDAGWHLVATTTIYPGQEVFLAYGRAYWGLREDENDEYHETLREEIARSCAY